MRAIGWLLAVLGGLCCLVWFLAYGLVWSDVIAELPVAFHAIGGSGLLLIGGWLFLDWNSLKELGKDQTVGQAFTASFALLLGLAITVILNFLGYNWDYRKDLTTSKKYSLSDQSVEIATKLDREIEVQAFFVSGSPEASNFRELIQGYVEKTSLLKINYYDPYSDPLIAEKAGLTSASGTVILKAGEAEQRIEYDFNEEAITNALVKVTSTKSHTLCVVENHGEAAATDAGSPEGMGVVFGKLEKQNYTVRAVQLVAEQPTPESCEVLVLAGPKTDLLASEMDRVAAYVAGGGNLIALLNPIDAPLTAADMSRYGVRVANDVVVEPDPYRQIPGGGPTWVVLDPSSYAPHAITEKLNMGTAVLPLVRSVGKGAEIPGLTVTELARSTEAGWGETDLSGDPEKPSEPNEGELVGRVPLAVAVEVTDPAAVPVSMAPSPPAIAPVPAAEGAPVLPTVTPVVPAPEVPKNAGGKVVVVGDADFASNQFATLGVNQDLFMNTVAWMADEANQISIRANEDKRGKLEIGVIQALVAALVALIGVPGLAAVGAVGTWMRRRQM